jgi:hypothetical protein
VGKLVPYEIIARRPGDVASCFTNRVAAEKIIGWRAQFGIERMCANHWRWQSTSPRVRIPTAKRRQRDSPHIAPIRQPGSEAARQPCRAAQEIW